MITYYQKTWVAILGSQTFGYTPEVTCQLFIIRISTMMSIVCLTFGYSRLMSRSWVGSVWKEVWSPPCQIHHMNIYVGITTIHEDAHTRAITEVPDRWIMWKAIFKPKKSQRGASCLPEITRFLPVANTIFFSSLSNKQTIDWVVERRRAVGFIHWRMRKKNAHYISNAKQSKLVTIKIMRRVQKI